MTEHNALVAQTLSHGTVRVTSTPMVARRGVLRERRPMAHQGTPGCLLADAEGQIVAWIAEESWRQAPAAPAQRKVSLNGIAPRQSSTPWGRANGQREKLRLNHDPRPEEPIVAAKPKARTPELKGCRASPWHGRMVGWLGEIVDPLPRLFSEVRKGEPLRPFKTGLHHDLYPLLRPDVVPKRLKTWLTNWCASLAYVEAVAAPGSMRHDVEGRPVGPVAEEDRRQARDRLPALRQEAATAIAAAKRQAEAKPDQVDGPLDALGDDQGKAAEWCADCLNPSTDLEDGICGGCRAAANPVPGGDGVDERHIQARRAAKAAKQQRFVGKPCAVHGEVERYTCNGRCVTCAIDSAKRSAAR